MKRHGAVLFYVVLLAAWMLQGQNADQKTGTEVAAITFDRVWEAYTPQSVTITVQTTGAAKYVSRNPVKTAENAEVDEDYLLEFTMSPANRDRLFRYAKEANYFNGDFSFRKHVVSSTGKKTLTYIDPARHFDTGYDYSENKAIQEITDIFQGISNTIEHGRKLQFMYRYDKLGLEAELKGMESAVENHNLAEIKIIAPTLEKLASDTSVLHIARLRAQRLLAKAASE